MFLIVLLWLSIGFFIFGLIYFIIKLKKDKGKSINRKLFVPTCCLSASIFLHRYIIGFYEVIYSRSKDIINAGYNLGNEISNSLLHTFQTFSLDEQYLDTVVKGKDIFLNEYNSCFLAEIYGFFTSVQNLVAPIIGGAIILGILTSIFPRMRLFFMPFREKFIFSELNERAVCFAEDIVKEADKNKYKRPLIVFTDAYIDPTSETTSELFQRAKDIGGICLEDDLLKISFNHTKKLYYILIDNKDIDNIHALTAFVTEEREDWKKGSYIYLFSQNSEASAIVRKLYKDEWLKDSEIIIEVVQEYTSIVYNLFDEVPLYYPLLTKYALDFKGKKELVLTIIGGGKIATEAFLGAYWFGQMLDCKLKINVLTKNADKFKKKIDYINHEILKSSYNADELLRIYPNKEEYSDPYAEFFFDKIDAETGDFNDYLKKDDNAILSSDYFIVALGTDELNMEAALNIDRMIQKETLNGHIKNTPVIAFSVYNSDTNKLITKKTNIQSTTNSAYLYAFAFASLKNIYSCKNIELNHVVELAFDTSKSHREIIKKIFLRDEYYYWSSIARVLHYKYDIYSAGLLSRRDISGGITNEEIIKYHNEIETNEVLNRRLSWLEHRRWNAFMRAKGFSAPTPKQWEAYAFNQNDEEKTHKNLELKLHPCIVERSEVCQSSIGNWDEINSIDNINLDYLDIASINVYQAKKERIREDDKNNFKQWDTPNELAKKMMEKIGNKQINGGRNVHPKSS